MEYVILGGVVILVVLAVANLVATNSARKEKDSAKEERQLNLIVSEAMRVQADGINNTIRNSNALILEANDKYNKAITENFGRLTEEVKTNLAEIKRETNDQLDKMRATVDEKLSENLEKRFSVIAERMDAVVKGLGEMTELSKKVGSLNNVLANVKTRGTWGEVALNSLLEQILTENQFVRQAQVKKGSLERVDFAVVMPGKDKEKVLLPIDSKFPLEDYQRIVEASEIGNAEALTSASKSLEQNVKAVARSIKEKYINPPVTTDFAIMYLPTEGLYAEVLRRSALVEQLQNELKVLVAGPTTIAALLNSLQLGFQTLAIEKSSAEIRKNLITFRKDFSLFKEDMEKSYKQIGTVSGTIEGIIKRTDRISERLGKLDTLKGFEDVTEQITD